MPALTSADRARTASVAAAVRRRSTTVVSMPPSASEDFRNKENGGIKNEPKKKEKGYEVEPPKPMTIPDFLSTFPWGGGA